MFCFLGTTDVNLDLIFAKYDPTTFLCVLSSCCVATPQTGLCNTIQIMNDSLTSNGVEEGYLSDVEKTTVSGPYYSYLVYVEVPLPGNPALLKLTNAQIRMWSSASARNPAATFNMYASPEQKADSGFTPRYWAVFCLLVDNSAVITTKDLANTSTSAFSFTVPLPSDYCA